MLQSSWVTLVISLLLTGCQKDGQGMQLIAEGFGETKAAVDGNYCYWVDGETVRINHENYLYHCSQLRQKDVSLLKVRQLPAD